MSRGLWSREGIERMLDEHAAGGVNHGARIWELLALELWFRTYPDRTRGAFGGPAAGILPGNGRGVKS